MNEPGDALLQSIWYELDGAYSGEDPDLCLRIVATLSKLPDSVRAFALDRCHFTSVGRATNGVTLPGRIGVHPRERRSRNTWVIVLSEVMAPDDVDSVIAHEIAHAWLGHDRLGDAPVDCEITASHLTAEWDFTGAGADPDRNDI